MKVVLSFQQAFQSTGGTSDSTDQGRRETACQGSYTTLKLHSNPAEENSPIYGIQVPYFKSGTCEQFLEFMDQVQAVIIGQNLTTGPQSCVHANGFEG